MNKRRIFGIVLFVGIGLFMLTFANPNDRVRENSGEEVTENTTVVTPEETPVVNPVLPAPVVAPVNDGVDLALELANAKERAIAELTNYKSDHDYADVEAYEGIVDEYTAAINNATTVNEVNTALENGKKAIDNLIEAEFAAYKEAAKEEIKAYAEETDADKDSKDAIVTEYSNKIDEALNNDAVDTLVEAAKDELDDLAKEELAAYKKAAKEELEAYAEETDADKDSKDAIVTEYSNKIDEALNKDAVDTLVEAAKDELDDLAKEELAAYKKAAKEELAAYANELGLNEDLAGETVVVYNNLIDEALTKAGVDTALSNGKAALDEVLRLHELDAAISEAIEALEEYAEGIDANADDKAAIVLEYTEKLEAVKVIENVEPTLNDGKAALDNLFAEELAALKTAAKEELATYATTIVATAEGKTGVINEYNPLINAATTKEGVNTALENGKAALVTLANNEFAAAKTAAKEELTTYAATKTIEEDVEAAILVEYNDAIDAVEPYDYEAITTEVTNGKAALDAAEAALALKNYKAAAVTALKEYAATKVITDPAKGNAITTYTSLINNAIDNDTVDAALARGKEALDILERDQAFANAKINALEELKTYAATKDLYKEDKESILSQYETIINAVEAYKYDEIAEAVVNGKAAIDAAEAKKALDQYKALAVTALNNYGKDLEFSTEKATVVAGYKTNAVNAINAATTKALVDTALANAKALIDEVVEIRLNGDATVTIVEKMAYTDASVTVISTKYTINNVIVDNKVNNKVVGNYKVTYTIKNSNHKVIASAIRDVNVIARAMTGISIKLAGTEEYSRNINVTYVEGLVNSVNIEVYKDFNDNTHEKLGKAEEKCSGPFWNRKCHYTEGYLLTGSFDGKTVTAGKTMTYTYSKNANVNATFTYVIERKSVTSIVPETQTGSYKVDAAANTVKATINYNNNTTENTTCVINNFNTSVEGSFETTMTCAGQEFAYNYTVAYSKDQIEAKASDVDVELFSKDNSIEFSDLGILTVKKIEQVHFNIWGEESLKRTITLGEGTSKFYLGDEDFDALWNNNSFFGGDYIKVTYSYGSIEVAEYYGEIFGYTW